MEKIIFIKKFIVKYLGGKYLFLTFSFAFILAILEIFYIFSLYKLSKYLIDNNSSLNNLYYYFIAIILISLFKLFIIRLNFSTSYKYSFILFKNFYSRYLNASPFSRFSLQNHHISNIFFDASNSIVNQFISQMSIFISSLSCIFLILIFIIYSLDFYSLVIIFLIFLFFIIFSKITKNRIYSNSRSLTMYFKKNNEIINNSLIAFREIILNNQINKFINEYNYTQSSIRKLQAYNQFLGNSPKIIVEVLSLLLIFLVIKFTDVISFDILIILVLSLYKLLPYFHNINYSFGEILSSYPNLIDLDSIDKKLSPDIDTNFDIVFKNNIKFNNISLCYDNSTVFTNLNFEFNMGDKILLLGSSGSGKSSFINLLLGFIPPTSGSIVVDDHYYLNYFSQSWGRNFSIVTHSTFIFNDSIFNNLLYQGSLSDYFSYVLSLTGVSSLGDLNQIISEETLSTGQRQRIGLARALLKQPKILILDEAINSLDYSSRQFIIEKIFADYPQMTTILVSHFDISGINFNKTLNFSDLLRYD
jgi:ABC-type multidrug transport system fused ATPase/permease subunit